MKKNIEQIQGVKKVEESKMGSFATFKAHLSNNYTVSILVHEDQGRLMERNMEVAVVTPMGNLIPLEDEDTIQMMTYREALAFIEEIAHQQMAHIENVELARIVKQLKESNSEDDSSFSGSLRYTRLFARTKNELIRGALRYNLEFEVLQEVKGLLMVELFFKVSGKSEDLLKFIYALDSWLNLEND